MSTAAPRYAPDRRADDVLPTPLELRRELAVSEALAARIDSARETVRAIVRGADPRLLVVVGPCSIHDVDAALEYARHIGDLRERFSDRLFLVMRVYVEKPRTSVGWKGLVNDPRLDGSARIPEGIRVARRLLLDVASLGVPIATEFVDPNTAIYFEDLITWGAVGARTVESPSHRHLASGLLCPIGFKNTTSGDVAAAVNAVRAAREAHRFVAIADHGRAEIVSTTGNPDCHVILRGGEHANHDESSVFRAVKLLQSAGCAPRVMIDCGHGNALRTPGGQAAVARSVSYLSAAVPQHVLGVMIESNLVGGCQPFGPRETLRLGQSVTDPCLGIDETTELLELFAHS